MRGEWPTGPLLQGSDPRDETAPYSNPDPCNLGVTHPAASAVTKPAEKSGARIDGGEALATWRFRWGDEVEAKHGFNLAAGCHHAAVL